jgi:kinesin family protein 4/21/27
MLGIIPRAAQLLFEKLEGPKHSRTSSTGLRTPSRYSVSSTSSFGKSTIDKNWQLKATYVEVCVSQFVAGESNLGRSTMNN